MLIISFTADIAPTILKFHQIHIILHLLWEYAPQIHHHTLWFHPRQHRVPRALGLIGATGGDIIEVTDINITPGEIQFGESIKIEVDVMNPDSCNHNLTMEYIIHHVRNNGRTIPKVFRLSSFELGAQETKHITKIHSIKAVGVRTYYAGYHQVDIVVNGIVKATSAFSLKI